MIGGIRVFLVFGKVRIFSDAFLPVGGILPPVEAELDFRLISLIHAPAMCNLHVGEIFIFFQFDHFIFFMLIFLVAFPANFTNMGTSQCLT